MDWCLRLSLGYTKDEERATTDNNGCKPSLGGPSMKILMTSDLYTPAINGVVTSIQTLKQALEAAGHEVRVLTLSPKPGFDEKEGVYSVSSISLNKIYPGARVSFTTTDWIKDQILNWQPELIHTHCEFSTFKMAKAIAKDLAIPIVHTYHTIYEDYTHYFSPNKKMGKKIVSLMSKHLLNQVNYVIAPTQKVKDMLMGYQVQSSIAIIPTGIPSQKFSHVLSQAERQELRSQAGYQEGDRLLVFLGRLAKEKNLSEILDYLSQREDSSLKLMICGDGPYKASLQSQVNELGLSDRVHFTGMVDPNQVANYYQMADLFVSASTSETQGLTYIEALFSGLPLLCRQDDSLKEVIQTGLNGFAYQDVEDFYQKLDRLLADPKTLSQMGDFARSQALQSFSAQAFGQAVSDLYEEVLDDHVPASSQAKSHKGLSTLRTWG